MNRRFLVCMLAGLGGVLPPGTAPAVLVDGVVAYVNEHVVTAGEVQNAMAPVVQRLRAKYRGKELAEKAQEAFREALNMQIDRFLILDAYNTQQGRIPKWVVDQRIEQIIREEFKGDRAALMDALTRDRQVFDNWREEIQDFIVVSSMRSAAVAQNIRVSPAAVQEYYSKNTEKFVKPSQVHIRMIVLRKTESPEETARKQAQAADIRKKIKDGADFGETATKASEGRKATEGGDWGWVKPEDLQPELIQAIAKMKTGEISDLIDTREEIYIMKLEGRRDPAVVPLEEAQAEIEMELRKVEAERLYKAWIVRLKEKAYVKILEQDVEQPDSP